MKLLMFNTNEFWYKTFSKTIEGVETVEKEESISEAIVAFVNAEKDDEGRKDEVVRKAVDNISWLARKNARAKILLHAFAHLSESKSSPEFAQAAIEEIWTAPLKVDR
ncbi:hypothetical protein HY992_04630 [Candidatus Micrarchaeota archaeon]|nr:hypothetical protein [Candidatus Micrarchaeota archaeon]